MTRSIEDYEKWNEELKAKDKLLKQKMSKLRKKQADNCKQVVTKCLQIAARGVDPDTLRILNDYAHYQIDALLPQENNTNDPREE